jgi:TniQ
VTVTADTMTPVRPLPRSLAPLPDESLPGYLLRLAHRLDLSPAHLAVRTGLAPTRTAHLPAGRMFALDPAMADQFAAATRLSGAEVAALSLASLGGRYPPLNPQPTDRQRPIHGVVAKQTWVFGRSTRYCPDCLAGDGSIIEQRHGGAWNKLWRLPVVFACPIHQQLLSHACPACARPAHFRATPGSQMLPLAGHPGLHPAACRNPILVAGVPGRVHPCGQRLDDPATRLAATLEAPDGQGLFGLQTKVLALLGPHHPGAASTVDDAGARYFTDLRILACLITASWPAARDLVTRCDHADLIDRHVDDTRRQIEAARTSGRAVAEGGFYDRPPPDAATCAALLTAADTITTVLDPTSVRQLLRRCLLAAPDPLRLWVKKRLTGSGRCSPRLQAAAGLETVALHIVRQASGRTHQLLPPPRPVRFGIQHVPQHPLPAWCDQYLTDFTEVTPRLLRRAVAVRLAQTCAGGPPSHAGTLLGLPASAASHAVSVVRSQLGTADRRAAFDAAIDALVEHLDTATDLVDYGKRRNALAAWTITPDQWRTLTRRLVDRPRAHGGPPADWGEAKRILASVWVWVRVTHGEHIYATPVRPNPQQPAPGGWLPHYVHHRWRFIAAGRRGHYTDLRELLNPYADQLIRQIDSNCFDPAPARRP